MVPTIISAEKLQVPAGAVLRIPATWQEYQQLAQQRGDSSIPRMKYRHGEVLFRSPTVAHARDAGVLGDAAKTLLDQDGREYEAFAPITLEVPGESSIEPDCCFYIDNWQAISGKRQIDWQQDPPPDLVIEMDVTSYSDVADYLPYQVPEVWLWKNQSLKIYHLEAGDYALTSQSRLFPSLDLADLLKTVMQEAYARNSSFAIRNLRQRLRC
jgi:Uma2 family endonuclease